MHDILEYPMESIDEGKGCQFMVKPIREILVGSAQIAFLTVKNLFLFFRVILLNSEISGERSVQEGC